MSAKPSPRPKYYDLNLAHLPAQGLLSIFHRVTGALLFFPVLPLALYLLQSSLVSEDGYAHIAEFFRHPVVKLALLGAVWLYAHHFFAGIRYLLLDLHIGIAKSPSRSSAIAVFVLGLVATLAIGWWLW
jgi:succinate dehydrogenase / fumarate reductase cytochrome b subunit